MRRAALAEFAEHGHGGFAIESVARRSGVAKSTIYRHWSGAPDLIADALATVHPQPLPDPASGDARSRVVALLQHLATGLADPERSALLVALVEAAEHDPALAALHHRDTRRRMQTLVDVLADGVAAEELPADLDPEATALCLAGALFYRRLMTATPLAPEEVDGLVDLVLRQSGIPS